MDDCPFVYCVNYQDELTYMNDTLADFAERNGAPGLAQMVIGKLLWDYIEGPDVQHIYGVLMRKLRSSMNPTVLPFRFDSPSGEYSMEMMIVPLSEGAIEFRTHILDGIPLQRRSHHDDALLEMCSTCKKVNTKSGWLDLEIAVGVLDYFNYASPPGFSHGLCDECHKLLVKV